MALTTDANKAWAKLAEATQRHRDAEIDDAMYAALYFIYGIMATHGARFASRRYRSDLRPAPSQWLAELSRLTGEDLRTRLLHYLSRYHFLGVIPNGPVALCAWLRGEWALLLYEYIPASQAVLQLQAQGQRPVTLIAAYPRLLQAVLNKPNALAFMIHDLEHAYKFFHDPQSYAAQREFFARIAQAMARGDFSRYLRDPVFAAKFDYLISDMNTHVMHSLHYLRAVLIECELRRAGKLPRERLGSTAATEIAAVFSSLAAGWPFDAAADVGLVHDASVR